MKPTMHSLPEGYRALVIGATGAIGAAMVRQLEGDARCAKVMGLARSSQPVVDFADASTIANAANTVRAHGPFHLVVIATGTLHGAQGMPEKRMAQLRYDHMEAVFRTNTFGPALALSHFAPLLDKSQRSVMAVLSAKVGSIGDNRLGGWYSYRASKAALNMLLKTAAIEVQRSHPLAVLAALHPGTVDSALSAPFRGAEIGRPATEAAEQLLAVLDGLAPEKTGEFWAYDGQHLPW
jgi:NAD(P)-dependent dehydrogenase (short-subunit alcohol dehydrogenase family)